MERAKIKVRWDEREEEFTPGSPVKIGREPSSDIVIDDLRVSRQHAELRFQDGGWVFHDMGSTQGSFIDGQRVEQQRLASSMTVVLGRDGGGIPIEVAVRGDDAPTHRRESRQRPGGPLKERETLGPTVVTGETINVQCQGESYSFGPSDTVTIGRDPECDVPTTNPTVGRRHATLQHVDGEWVIEDLGSANGTWVDGRRVTRHTLMGSTPVWLGDQDAGERIVTVTRGHRSTPVPWRRVFMVTAALAALALAVVALVWLPGSSGPDLERLAQATVRLSVGQSGGSGTIIDADEGLILTNAHVAAPTAPGQPVIVGRPAAELAGSPDEPIVVSISPGLDQAAEPRYVAEIAAVDGYLDLAVLRITRRLSGALVGDDLEGLVDVELGDSGQIRSGDQINVLGYPAVSRSRAATVTRGIVAGSVQDDRIATNRALLNVDADINPGNSGGLAADQDGRAVGVPTLNFIDASDPGARRGALRPIAFAEPLIEAARNAQEYESPHVQPLLGSENVTGFTLVSAGRAGLVASCQSAANLPGQGDRAVAVSFDYVGFGDVAHQDLLVRIERSDGRPLGAIDSHGAYPFEFQRASCLTATIPLSNPLEVGEHLVAFYAGPRYTLIGRGSFEVS